MTHYPDIIENIASQTAVIREHECIGCTKCIQACPVDAIIGAAKQMHTVIGSECIGCGLCLPPCPVDCIDLVSIATLPASQKQLKTEQAKTRFDARNLRLKNNQSLKKQVTPSNTQKITPISLDEIKAAVERVMTKRNQYKT